MILNQFNLNYLKVFEEVYKTRSMTQAADRLHLTQSGVSQHIRALEDSLDLVLFDRINQKLIPTSSAKDLYQQCTIGLNTIEQALWRIKGDKHELSGTVNIGMPIEFGNNVIIPILSEFGKKYPKVKFQIFLDFASKLNDLLLEGQLDFAFVDEYKMDKRVVIENVFTEKLSLCISKDLLPATTNNSKKFFEGLPYVDYQQGAPVLKMWFEHHLKGAHLNINIRAMVMDVQGLARFIITGFGAGVLPMHVVRKLEKEGHNLHVFKVLSKDLENHISVAAVANKSQSPTAESLLKFLKEALKKKTS